MKSMHVVMAAFGTVAVALMSAPLSGQDASVGNRLDGKRLFDRETFGGNGRACVTCHSRETGTVSPEDARRRLAENPNDPLFVHDGSDDGAGNGTSRMLADATVLMQVPLADNVRVADDPLARTVTLRRGIPTTLNTPALDPELMVDGRQPSLEAQAAGAIHDHAQATVPASSHDLERLREFQLTDVFFSSPETLAFARGSSALALPAGTTSAEQRGRRFFEDVADFGDAKHGACAACHAGPMLNQTNEFLELIVGVPRGTRFQSILVSELNALQNPLREFIFTNQDGSESHVWSPDPGRALVTGIGVESGLFDNVNAFKISPLWGVARTAPYFHDNSAKTLEAVMEHYATFFAIISDPDGPGPMPPGIALTAQDQADMVAYMKLLR
jgi:cytochrome c peroxidase